MKIACIGGGPGGLYAALLLRRSDPTREITVFDRNPVDATYGWGVVFSDETLGFLEENDRESFLAISREFVHWEAIDVHYRGSLIHSGGHAFSGLSRRRLLNIMQGRCREVGVRLLFEAEVDVHALEPTFDLIIAADGVNSHVRLDRAGVFKPSFDVHKSKYIWLGAPMHLDAFTFAFVETRWGMFQAHAYPFEPQLATFIVECNQEVWKAAGMQQADESESIAFCEQIFASILQGTPLLSNRSSWLSFVTLRNESWSDGNVVLLGDSAHTAHFSVGSGTKIAMEDAIALAHVLDGTRDLRAALIDYEELRQPSVERTQQAARDSSLWFEHVRRYARFEPLQFGFSLLTRSKRITYDNLRLRDPQFAGQVDAWFSSQTTHGATDVQLPARTPLANPLLLRDLVIPNRLVVVGDECAAVEGVPNATKFTSLLTAGAMTLTPGMMLTAPVAVSPEGRITLASPGLYSMPAADAWQRVVADIHQRNSTLVGLRLSHAGPRGATRPHSEGIDLPLVGEDWPLLSASAVAYSPYARVPAAMERADMDRVRDAFVEATRLACPIQFDLLELDFSHGYLLATFLSPLTNRREDRYGGNLSGRLRYPLEILAAVRAVWPEERPIAVAFSVTDWARGGIGLDDAIASAAAFRENGADLLHVVTGQTLFGSNPAYGRNWEAPFGDAIRNEAGTPVLLGGNIVSDDDANTLLAAGRADLCLMESPITAPVESVLLAQ